MHTKETSAYQTWLVGETLLIGLLLASLALFSTYPTLVPPKALPDLRLVIDTAVMLAGMLVAILTTSRFKVEGRWIDLLLATGFLTVSASILLFAIVPVLTSSPDTRSGAWADLFGRLLGWTAIALGAGVRGRVRAKQYALGNAFALVAAALVGVWLLTRSLGPTLPELSVAGPERPALLSGALALEALALLGAAVGFGLRFRRHGEDLDSWLALGATLMLFAPLNLMFRPLLATQYVSQADFLTVLAYGVLMAGVWRAILQSEFGRAVAEERARVAREIHDGLAQYLFAISTYASMIEAGADSEHTIRQLKDAATAAQQEAKFAVLALSSAAGNAPFDAALRRYVEFLVADGELEVEVEIDQGMRLGPDEQIEVFRIVQEGLANVRKHAGARRAEVAIRRRGIGERIVVVRDDGAGFVEAADRAGQGLRNMRERAARIGGSFELTSTPGFGTALEIVLRT